MSYDHDLQCTDDIAKATAALERWLEGPASDPPPPLEGVHAPANSRGPYFWLPHRCDAWEIGSLDDAKRLRDDLSAAIELLEDLCDL
ncbi:MAG: hypothetical protein ACR2P5_06025 [Gammaproteobacteria bacterium]